MTFTYQKKQSWTTAKLFQKTFIKQKQRPLTDQKQLPTILKIQILNFHKCFNASDCFWCILVKIFMKIWIHSFGIGWWIQWVRKLSQCKSSLAIKSSKKNQGQQNGLENRGHLKVLNWSQMSMIALPFRINFVSFQIFRRHLFLKTVSCPGLFATSYSKTALTTKPRLKVCLWTI